MQVGLGCPRARGDYAEGIASVHAMHTGKGEPAPAKRTGSPLEGPSWLLPGVSAGAFLITEQLVENEGDDRPGGRAQ